MMAVVVLALEPIIVVDDGCDAAVGLQFPVAGFEVILKASPPSQDLKGVDSNSSAGSKPAAADGRSAATPVVPEAGQMAEHKLNQVDKRATMMYFESS